MPYFIPVLRRLGDSWEVPDDMMDVLENSRTTSVNELYNMKLTHFSDTAASTFETSKSLNFLNRSPCQRLPEQYITCVNYLHVVPIWKQDHNCRTRHFHRTSMDMAGQSRMGPWSHPSLSDVLSRRLADLEEEGGSDDNSDE